MAEMKYGFLIDTYATECVKVVSAWSMFRDRGFAGAPESIRCARAKCTRAHGAPMRE